MSSPNGTGNTFHQLYEGARNNENGFNCRFGNYTNPNNIDEKYNDRLPWWVHPEHDLVWFEAESRDKSPRDVAQEFLCFSGDTRIATKHGFRKLKDIEIGDEVLTHKGRFKKVLQTNKRKTNEVYEIQTFLNKQKSYVTQEHPILTSDIEWEKIEDIHENNQVCVFPKNIDIKNEIKILDIFKLINPNFFKLKICENDSNLLYLNDRRFKTLHKRNIEIDYSFGYFLGIFLAEGHINKNTISLSFNYPNEINTWVAKIIEISKNKFGLSNLNIYNTSKSRNFKLNFCYFS